MLKRRLKEPFGKAGLTVAVIALVFGLIGGAYAAGGLTKSQEKQVTKIAKKYAGKPGSNGPAGPAGPQGPAGTSGKDGSNGTNGTSGINGKTVLHGTSNPTGAVGTEGDFYINTTSDEIFGPKGASSWGSGTSLKGETGFTEALPSGKTETGTWGFTELPKATATFATSFPISFPIPLSASIGQANVHVFEGTTAPTGCSLTAEGELGADPGSFCVHLLLAEHVTAPQVVALNMESNTAGVGKSGAVLSTAPLPEGAIARGAWAVTAP